MGKIMGLLLPPDFIHTKEFHECLLSIGYSLDLVYKKYDSNEHRLWHTVIGKTIDRRESFKYRYSSVSEQINIIRYFCADVRGIYEITEDGLEHILTLEGLSNVPCNFLDKSSIEELLDRYNYYENYIVEFRYDGYKLLDIHSKYIGYSIEE
jgi:hypothetical protein